MVSVKGVGGVGFEGFRGSGLMGFGVAGYGATTARCQDFEVGAFGL